MTHEERNNIVAIIINLLIVSYFGWRIYSMFLEDAFAGEDGLAVWAQTVLWIIPASIAGTIIATIIFNILFSIATNDGDPDDTVDERDRSIGIKGMRVTMVVASAAFIGALIGLAMGWTPFIVFNIILAGFALGDLIGNLVKLTLYRAGV